MRLSHALDHPIVLSFMAIITIFALFGDDLRILCAPKSADDLFNFITVFCIICYALEIVLASLAIDGYFLDFFFWLDIVSTLSMIADCGWIWDYISDASGNKDNAEDATSLAKTARAGRITRIIRIIRIVRLIRVVKLYKQAQLARKRQAEAKIRER